MDFRNLSNCCKHKSDRDNFTNFLKSFMAGFCHLKPLCGSGGGPAGDSGGLGGQQISMPTKLTQLRYSGYSAEFLDRVEPNGNIPGKNGTAGIAGMYVLKLYVKRTDTAVLELTAKKRFF